MAVRTRTTRRRLTLAAVATIIIVVVAVIALRPGGSSGPGAPVATGPKNCVYTRESIVGFEQAARLLQIPAKCSLIFHRAAPDWAAWDTPWFISSHTPNNDWASWAAQKGNRLIITLGLIPASAVNQNWRSEGASGAYKPYARILAQNLIRAGLGKAIIRLSNEANGSWFTDNAGTTPTENQQWVQFWRNTVTAMRSVSGAHFTFDWTVADTIGSGSLSAFYPGDSYVDYIGDDIYDAGLKLTPAQRWQKLASGPRGVDAVVAFARAHHKLFSVPEWGLQPTTKGGGNDPAFVNDIARLTKASGFGYQSYFFADTAETTLAASPQSLTAYRHDFGSAQ
jgi:hypothetical protein